MWVTAAQAAQASSVAQHAMNYLVKLAAQLAAAAVKVDGLRAELAIDKAEVVDLRSHADGAAEDDFKRGIAFGKLLERVAHVENFRESHELPLFELMERASAIM